MTKTSSSSSDSRLTPFTGEFACREKEAGFLRRQLPGNQRQLRGSLLFCSAFYIAFAVTDVAVLGYGREALILLIARLSVGLAALAGIGFARARPRSVVAARFVATAVEVLAMLTFLLIATFRSSEMLLHGMAITIMVIIVYIFIPNRLAYSLAVALGASAAFMALATALGRLQAPELLTMGMLLLLANLFGAVAARRYERLARVQAHAQEILTNMSVRDHLTGVFNRRHLNEHLLDAEIVRARRYRLKLTLVMCDIDHFKSINDTLGHHAGDAVLRAFAGLLTSMTREGVDAVVRYGGEEFFVILPETDLSGGAEFAQRVRSSFASGSLLPASAPARVTTASFGVVSVDFSAAHPGLTQHALIDAADKLMYEAKHGGRNQVRSLQFA